MRDPTMTADAKNLRNLQTKQTSDNTPGDPKNSKAFEIE